MKQTNLLPIEQINALSLRLNNVESKYSQQYSNIWESLDILDNELQKTNKELDTTQKNVASFMIAEVNEINRRYELEKDAADKLIDDAKTKEEVNIAIKNKEKIVESHANYFKSP